MKAGREPRQKKKNQSEREKTEEILEERTKREGKRRK